MPNRLTPQEYQAVQNYANGLIETFTNYKKHNPDRLSDIVIDYVIKIIDIHLQLKELNVERYLTNLKISLDKTG